MIKCELNEKINCWRTTENVRAKPKLELKLKQGCCRLKRKFRDSDSGSSTWGCWDFTSSYHQVANLTPDTRGALYPLTYIKHCCPVLPLYIGRFNLVVDCIPKLHLGTRCLKHHKSMDFGVKVYFNDAQGHMDTILRLWGWWRGYCFTSHWCQTFIKVSRAMIFPDLMILF